MRTQQKNHFVQQPTTKQNNKKPPIIHFLFFRYHQQFRYVCVCACVLRIGHSPKNKQTKKQQNVEKMDEFEFFLNSLAFFSSEQKKNDWISFI